MNTLGISCFYHDSSAALVSDGKIMAAAQEERFSRERNTSEFPIQAINFCVQFADITFDDIDSIAYFEKPFLKFSRVLIDHLNEWPFSYKSFMRSIPNWLDKRLSLPMMIQEEINFTKEIFFIKHHLSHAASAFLPSPFEEAAIMTVDGVGEWATMSRGYGKGNLITLSDEIRYPDSLGLLYTTFTVFLGFEANGGEGKTMGLAGYGHPSFLKELQSIVHVREDGSFKMDPKFFRYRAGSVMWSAHFEKLFGAPRLKDGELNQRHFDLAATVQKFLEDVLILNARLLQKKSGLKNLSLAGGVTLNCLTNHKILEQTDFQKVYIQPAAGDAGGSLGAALYVQHCVKGLTRNPEVHSFFGPSYLEREMESALKRNSLSYKKLSDAELVTVIAEHLNNGKTIAWFQGQMEFGPRALGNRSILASPVPSHIKDHINGKIKHREWWRPLAPVVLEEKANEYFDLKDRSPYMLLAANVKEEVRLKIPAVTHIDGTARVQTLDQNTNPLLRSLIQEFSNKSGVPMLLNTSFNRKGEPVVCTPGHAIDCFQNTPLDVLCLGPFVVEKGHV